MMNRIKSRPAAFLLAVLLLALAGCSTKSPTEPSTGGGSTPPPTGDVVITLSASNPSPLKGSLSIITAKVTIGGQNAINGTAVEFETSFGTFTETGTTTALRSTSGGAATVTLTSPTVGNAVVTARVGTVSRTVNVNFRDDGGPVSGAPTLSAVTPSSGPPAGNQNVTISGTNLKAPVRAFFGTKEAIVLSSTETEIKVLTPPIDLGSTEQARLVDVKVITKAGASDETAATLTGGYRYELEILTPTFNGLSPVSGPNEGNTRITIVGAGFQSPCRVFFGTGGGGGGSLTDQVELEVVSVSYSQIVAITPPASGLGSSFRDAQVTMRIQNVASNKDVVVQQAFRYGPKIVITAISPTYGPVSGGTRVTINGSGFEDPVAVSLSGVAAQIIRVSGTEIVCIASAPLITTCGAPSVTKTLVTNINTGATAEGPEWTYIFLKPDITAAGLPPSGGTPTEGGTAFADVIHAGIGAARIKIGTIAASGLASTYDSTTDITRYTFTIPAGVLEFTTEACDAGGGVAGTRNKTTPFTLTWEGLNSGCSATFDGFAVAPAVTTCVATAPPTPVAVPTSLSFGSVSIVDPAFSQQSGQICNQGGGTVTLSGATIAGTDAADFTFLSPLSTLTLNTGACANYTIKFNPTVVGTGAKAATFNVLAGTTPLSVSLSGTATP